MTLIHEWITETYEGGETFRVDVLLPGPRLPVGVVRALSDETTILRFRYLLQRHRIAAQVLATVNTALTQQGLLLKMVAAVGSMSASFQHRARPRTRRVNVPPRCTSLDISRVPSRTGG